MRRLSVTNPIFMIGMGRSGTSVISEAVSMQEDLGWYSVYLERFPTLVWLAILNRITSVPHLGLYLRGKKEPGAGGVSPLRKFLPHPTEAFPVWEGLCGRKFSYDHLIGIEASDVERTLVLNYVQKVLRLHGKRRFFAKFTGPPRIRYLTSIFPNAIFVHVVRDPRAVVASLLKVDFWRKGGGLLRPWWNNLPAEYVREWQQSGQTALALAAVQWKWVLELTWQEKNLVAPENYVEIRYEDFVQTPHKLLSFVFKQAGLLDSTVAHRYLDGAGKLRNMNYKYHSNLHPHEISLIENITTRTARKAGYFFSE